jgi:hypothetical protein
MMESQAGVHLLTTEDGRAWQEALPASRSVFASHQYARILEAQHGFAARLFAYAAGGSHVAYPFFLRPLASLGYPTIPGASFDTLTPEYAGPLPVRGLDVYGESFRAAWESTCRELGIVAEFAHLHPWYAAEECLDRAAVALDRQIVYIDLTLAPETLREEHFNYACRKNLRRAEAEGIEVFEAKSSADIAEFHRIYSGTMDRNNALGKYYFSPEFFMAFYETLSDNACFMLARHRGKVIAGTLYLHDDSDVYSYLGGADQDYQQLRPSNAVVWAAVQWAHAGGKQRLILGGGYRPDDGIFRFKSSFSPLRARFKVYRKIHLPAAYESLVATWSAATGCAPAAASYFPAYRAPRLESPNA